MKKVVRPDLTQKGSNIKKGMQMADYGYRNYGDHYRKNQIKKIAYHVFIKPRFTQWWFNFLTNSELSEVFKHRPLLYMKPYRVYISTKWNRKKALEVILDTYRFLDQYPLIKKNYLEQENGITLSNLQLGESSAEIRFCYDDQFRKEGDLTLTLYCDDLGGKVISTCFSITKDENDKWGAIVGCVQGHSTIEDPAAFKKTQKMMHGMRPNSVIMYALQAFISNTNCKSIRCVSDKHHSYKKKHAIHLPYIHTINFDYNQFWKEVGGVKENDWWYQLETTPTPHKDMSEIKSKKRAMYRRRFEMLDTMREDITKVFKNLGE
ncbi:VirK/YbjX family protein [Halosquirtibacter xylanolyticus]|uniref:DUF535 family protein n=1 Tax=Halosquirtibacter xylanolyticus TaxID=3374599 RepID=UPI00374A7E4F|nr:VirK/YbjX family protein [Prolixibacteraceae bacterium]